jgi:hypothetical protein
MKTSPKSMSAQVYRNCDKIAGLGTLRLALIAQINRIDSEIEDLRHQNERIEHTIEGAKSGNVLPFPQWRAGLYASNRTDVRRRKHLPLRVA